MSLTDYKDFVYGATLLDWDKESELMFKLRDKLHEHTSIRYIGEDTDLRASTEGRTWVASIGTHNMPSGEVFTSPVETSVEGHIYFDIPFLYSGTEIHGVRLEFKGGKVVKFSAEKGEAALKAALEVDEGVSGSAQMQVAPVERLALTTSYRPDFSPSSSRKNAAPPALNTSLPSTRPRSRSRETPGRRA